MQQKKILIVDDIPVNCKIVQMQLNKLGIASDIANNGQEAVMACMKTNYTLIFMDLDMPVMDGFLATKFIRIHERPLGIHTPILAVTSYDRPEDRQRCVKEGLDGFVRKGISVDELSAVISSYCLEDTGSRFPALLAERQAREQMGFDSELTELHKRFENRTHEILSDLIYLFRELQPNFDSAISERNARQLTHVAYSFKGSCSNAGLNTMAQLCARMADEGYAGRWHRASANYRRLMRMIEQVQERYSQAV
jgi:CheY-like chemotaxis protein